jgi:hypothetical protein
MPTPVGHLVGAYGLFWDRDLVDWQPGSGPSAWQLLGKRNERPPALRVADFRNAHGVYVLYDDYGARYTGLARGAGGLGARLRTHHIKPPRRIAWSRFSWFSFDDVVEDAKHEGWEQIKRRAKPVPTDSEAIIREIEALMITVLGTTQNRMRFQKAAKWEQLSQFEAEDLQDGAVVDPSRFTFRRYDQ